MDIARHRDRLTLPLGEGWGEGRLLHRADHMLDFLKRG